MCPYDSDATQPDADTCEPGSASPVPMLALVLVWSAAEPHRAGEIAFLHGTQWWNIGRGDAKLEEFAQFAPQCPGEAFDPARRAPCLQGKRMSQRQLAVRVHDGAVEMNQVGSCLTLVNGKEQRTARLSPGDTVLVRGMALFLCVRRQKVLPALGTFRELLHAFGETDAFGIVGESAAAWQLRLDLAAAARSPFHVLIHGETGVGKEMAAAAIHKMSGRRRGPFITSSAAVFTETLVETKLFGQVRNFPNPGTPAREGLFTRADGGTLFLDEIGDCPHAYQAALLRALESGEITVLGETLARHVDVRVVAATNLALSLLRTEMLARLKKRLEVPALRARREDIPLLIRHLALKRAAAEPELMAPFLYTGPAGRTEVRMSGRVVDTLVRHPLTSNVRELEILLDGLTTKSTGNEVRLPSTESDDGVGSGSVEPVSSGPVSGKPSEDQVRVALKSAKGNVHKAAEVLGVPSASLYRLITKYGIDRKSL